MTKKKAAKKSTKSLPAKRTKTPAPKAVRRQPSAPDNPVTSSAPLSRPVEAELVTQQPTAEVAPGEEQQSYEYVRAIVEGSDVRWEYQVKGLPTQGRQSHDEDVTGWSEQDILKLTRRTLDVPEDFNIEIEYA